VENKIQGEDRIFPICYEIARTMAKKAGDVVGIPLKPHDLRRQQRLYLDRVFHWKSLAK